MQTRDWHIQPQVDPPANILESVNQEKIAANYLLRRGITSPHQIKTYLEPDRQNLADPYEMPDMQTAVARIIQALDNSEVIGIWGDFDVDGQTSTAILVECLTSLGASVQYYLPVRVKESHGIALKTLQPFLDKGIQLLITCDTGISEHEAVQFANARQVEVIITDHHTLPEELPSALACINPRRLADDHALATLSGSGTAFEVMLAVCREKKQEEVALQCIDLAALGLIADLAALQKDARLIAQLGLQRMNQKPRICIQAMLTAASIKSNGLDEQSVGYVIAPRLNAFGRLDDANPLVSFLMDADPSAIPGIAQKLEQLNSDRRFLSSQVGQSAVDQYNRHPELSNDPIIILTNPDWPGGVLGLAANRLVTEFNRPAILLNESADGILRGSARSVEGINITEAIRSASRLLIGFGGHPMAAGMSLAVENLPEFRRSVNNWVKENGIAAITPPPLEIDAEIEISAITPDLYANLQKLAPFGVGNPPLLLCTRSVKIASAKALGRSREHFRFILEDQNGYTLPAIWWSADSSNIPSGHFDLAFSIRENYFQGESTLQAEWVDFHVLEDAGINLTLSTEFQLIDLRNSDNPLMEAVKMIGDSTFQIFREPPPVDNKVTVGRSNLVPTENLILASFPPSLADLEKIIHISQPQKIVLAFEAPAPVSLIAFLKHLSALIQHVLKNKDGLASMSSLAEAANSREDCIEAGINWLAADGKIQVKTNEHNMLQFSTVGLSKDASKKSDAENAINYKLKETLAFQKYIFSLSVEDLNNLLSSFIKPDNTANKRKRNPAN